MWSQAEVNSCLLFAQLLRDSTDAIFSKEVVYHTLCIYNDLLKVAKKGNMTELLSMLYADRSQIYFNIQQYEKCLENIQLAKENGYEDAQVLEDRELKCKEGMKDHRPDPEEDPWNFFKLSYPANKKIPFIVDCLEMRRCQRFGRGIYTKRDLKPGDVVAIEKCYFAEFNYEGFNQRCANCLKTNMLSLIPTVGDEMFCSQLCSDEFSQQQFKMVKKKDSKMPAFFKALSFSGGLKKLRSIMAEPDETTIFDYDWTEANGGEEQLNLLRCLLSLQKKSVLTHQALKMAKDCLDPTKGSRNAISLITNFLHQYLRIAGLNRTSLALGKVHHGNAILLFGSLFNHSCDANVTMVEADGKFIAVVRRSIQAGGQLFVKYTTSFISAPREHRQQVLKNGYDFECKCTACTRQLSINELNCFDDESPLQNFDTFGSVKESVQEVKRNNEYLVETLPFHPSVETVSTMLRNALLLRHIAARANCPFVDFDYGK